MRATILSLLAPPFAAPARDSSSGRARHREAAKSICLRLSQVYGGLSGRLEEVGSLIYVIN